MIKRIITIVLLLMTGFLHSQSTDSSVVLVSSVFVFETDSLYAPISDSVLFSRASPSGTDSTNYLVLALWIDGLDSLDSVFIDLGETIDGSEIGIFDYSTSNENGVYSLNNNDYSAIFDNENVTYLKFSISNTKNTSDIYFKLQCKDVLGNYSKSYLTNVNLD